MKTTIVIPTYNEKENIELLLTAIFNLTIPELSIIIIDDNSPDGTATCVKRIQVNHPISLIERKEKLGLGSAYIIGFKQALTDGADIIIEMDADFSHDPKDLPRLIQAIENSDIGIGSRKIAGGQIIGWNMRRHIMSNGAMTISRLFLGLKTHDITAGFRVYRRYVLEQISLDKIKNNGYAFQEEILWRVEKHGFRVLEIPVTFADREHGKSKLSKKDILEFFLFIFRVRFGLIK